MATTFSPSGVAGLDKINLGSLPTPISQGLGSFGSAMGLFGGPIGAIAGQVLPGILGAMGGQQAMAALDDGRDDIMGLPGNEALNLQGAFGSSSGATGRSNLNAQLTGANQAFGQMLPGLLGGGQFSNMPGAQQAFGSAGQALNPAFQNLQGVLGQQMGNQAFGGMQGLFNQSNQLGNMFAGQAAQGPRDQTGGAMGSMIGMGMGNMMAAGNQQGLFNQSLNTQRQAATQGGLLDNAINKLQNRQFATGRMGTTGGAGETQTFLDAVARQDLGFQNNAFGQAQQQQQFLGQLGQGQMGLGQGFLGQNLNQFNQGVGHAGNFMNMAGGFEGQGFGQNLQALQQNQRAGMQRLGAAQGLLGFGDDLFGSSFNRGLGATEGMLGIGGMGLDAAALPFELQASLLGASSGQAGALAGLAEAKANASGGLFGGIGNALGGLFG